MSPDSEIAAYASDPRMPNLFIVGAQKAGTTSLHYYLQQHPEIYMSPVKEPGYFIKVFNDPERFQTLKHPFNETDIRTLGHTVYDYGTIDSFLNLFRGAEEYYTRGESSTVYLPSPYAAKRIREVVPSAKIIIVLRDRAERAYSAYNFNKSRGLEPAASFRDAIEDEIAGNRKDWIYGWRYLYTGRYSLHIQRYYHEFGYNNVLIVRTHELKDEKEIVLKKLFDFLGIDNRFKPKGKERNITTFHHNIFLRNAKHWLTQPSSIKSTVLQHLPYGVKPRVKSAQQKLVSVIDCLGYSPRGLKSSDRDLVNRYYLEIGEDLEI